MVAKSLRIKNLQSKLQLPKMDIDDIYQLQQLFFLIKIILKSFTTR